MSPDTLEDQLTKYLTDVHSIEQQALAQMRAAPKLVADDPELARALRSQGQQIAGDSELASAYGEHLAETEAHARMVEERLEQRGGSPSKLKDAALRAGALNWGAFFAAQPDTPAKLAAFSYAFEHLEIAAYELLRRVAQRAGDADTAQTATSILAEERAAADKLSSLFGQALDASLHEQGIPV